MFQVQNQATYSQFQVATRDELLFELDLLNAKQKKKGTTASFDLFYLDENGRLVDKISIHFPLSTTVDEALIDFGHLKPKKAGFLKRLFSFKRKEKTVAVVPATDQDSKKEEVVEKEGIAEEADGRREELSVVDLLHSTALREEERASETAFHDEEFTEEAEMSLESQSHDLNEVEIDNSDSLFDHVADSSPLEEEVSIEEEGIGEGAEEMVLSETTVEDEKLSHDESDGKAKEEKNETASKAQPLSLDATILKVTSSRDVESLTVTRQKASFELQLQEEVAQIDQLIHQLEKQKQGHLKLLHHLQQFIAE